MIKILQARIGTAAEWAGTTPAAGTLCIESDTGVMKLADGSTVYGSLAALFPALGTGVAAALAIEVDTAGGFVVQT